MRGLSRGLGRGDRGRLNRNVDVGDKTEFCGGGCSWGSVGMRRSIGKRRNLGDKRTCLCGVRGNERMTRNVNTKMICELDKVKGESYNFRAM